MWRNFLGKHKVYKLILNYHKGLRSPVFEPGYEQTFLFPSKSRPVPGFIHPSIERVSQALNPRAGLAVLMKNITIYSLRSSSWLGQYSEWAIPSVCRVDVHKRWSHTFILTYDFMLGCIIKCSDFTFTTQRRSQKSWWYVNIISCRKANRCFSTTLFE